MDELLGINWKGKEGKDFIDKKCKECYELIQAFEEVQLLKIWINKCKNEYNNEENQEYIVFNLFNKKNHSNI